MANKKDLNSKEPSKKPKALALLSGGLDSMLSIKLILNQGMKVEAVNFITPFCLCKHCALQNFTKNLNLKVHRISLSEEFFKIILNPPHGYGSQMNPCIDCRILMFKKAKELAKNINADFIVTGEVLNERPFSQRKEAMFHIERESGLEGKVLRPLSAKILPESEPEKKGLVDRKRLHAIQGRRRLPQIKLANKLELKDYPCPSGGCLLTDPRFAERLKEHLKHESRLTLNDVSLLKVGRHFRIDEGKVVVGRNEEENKMLLAIAKAQEIPWIEVVNYKGPITLLIGKENPTSLNLAAKITARYSDAPKDIHVRLKYEGINAVTLEAKPITNELLEDYRI